MRLAVLVLALVSLCADSAIPLIPGDNSHYVEGESRYFWMPDGYGVPQLIDTQEPIDYAYLARKNGIILRHHKFLPTVPKQRDFVRLQSFPYHCGLFHGWQNDGNSDINVQGTQAVLQQADVNVIVLDWSGLASKLNYFTSVAGVPKVGQYLGIFLVWLINNAGGNWNNVHLVGHSLGAHVVENAGRQTEGLPARITGLDAALPGWQSNNDRLTTTDGIYVEAIHTDGCILGFLEPKPMQTFILKVVATLNLVAGYRRVLIVGLINCLPQL